MKAPGFPAARRIQISNVRGWSAVKFRALAEPLLVECHSDPVAVVLPYVEYLRMQEALELARSVGAALEDLPDQQYGSVFDRAKAAQS